MSEYPKWVAQGCGCEYLMEEVLNDAGRWQRVQQTKVRHCPEHAARWQRIKDMIRKPRKV